MTEEGHHSVRVKVCGVTSLADAHACVDAGVDWIGLNFWPGTPRRCELSVAGEIVKRCGQEARIVGVFVDASYGEILTIRERTGLEWAQLHGQERPEELETLLPHAYKAIRVSGSAALEDAQRYPGEFILLDAFAPGKVGGTGTHFDWALAREMASQRNLLLAGGLTPRNVGEAIRTVRPWGVDVASGVELSPGVKERTLVEAFVRAARAEV